MNTDFIRGVIPPIVTIIDENERIDEERMRRHVDFVIEGGVHGILAFGSNGEFYMVEEDEMKRGLQIILDETKGRVPVYFGMGTIKTRKCRELARMAAECGASGVSVLQPMFLKPTEDELYRHFRSIAEAVPGTPVLLYNNPGRVGYSLTTSLVTRLAADVDNIVGIKDSSGDMTLTSEFVRLMKTGKKDFKVFGGKDTLIYGALVHGADGAIATTANMFPELVVSIYEKYRAGDLKGSLEAQFVLNPVRISMDLASFPVATKDMAKLMGLDVGDPFLPNLPTSGDVLEHMRKKMQEAGLLA
ncbi:MAG: 4-hydroxy-tetrahydrodipicolinate synthase [Synergistaceae bacterium]|nr:4-hydroxy-tetrahydrodipicolinate synthase [Synergistaceae bacterium]